MNKKSPVYIAESKTGKGVFAERIIFPGELILIFKGFRVNWGNPIHSSSMGSYLLQTGKRTYIMPSSPGMFVNHSCNPNAGIIDNRRLVAIKKIEQGEEITFDYSTTMEEEYWTMDCLCKETNCRGVILDFQKLPEDIMERYLLLGIVQGFIAQKFKKKNIKTRI